VASWRLVGALACCLALAGCVGGGRGGGAPARPSATVPVVSASPGNQSPAGPSWAAGPAAPPSFVGTATPATPADVARSWHPGCPVGVDQLAVLRLGYWGFDDQPHVGTLVVNKDVAAEVTTVFRILYAKRFPIRQMRPVDVYGGDDDASMAADNTSGFNCRAVAGTQRWSQHAYGLAIDVNTVENPYLVGGSVRPPAGAAYLDRSVHRAGMAVPGGELVSAFASVGWEWGGRWTPDPDYQHFSKTGR
jgi:hypothetical protein